MNLDRFWLSAASSLLLSNQVFAVQPYSGEDPSDYNTVCVISGDGPFKKIQNILQSNHINYQINTEELDMCYEFQGMENLRRINLPSGLSSWLRSEIKKRHLGETTLGGGTAGGSGVYKSAVDRAFLYPDKITPDNIGNAGDYIKCSIERRLLKYFSSVRVVQSCGGSVQTDGLCWTAWTGGHLSNSEGLSSSALNGQISDKYWFSAKTAIDINYVELEPKETGKLQDAFRIDISTLSSKFARAPASSPPDPPRYQSIGDQEITGDSIDELIASRIRDIVMWAPLSCSKGQK